MTHVQPMLEDYVMQQVRDGTYDLDGNMALLKLYQFYPNSVRYEVCFVIVLQGSNYKDQITFRLSFVYCSKV